MKINEAVTQRCSTGAEGKTGTRGGWTDGSRRPDEQGVTLDELRCRSDTWQCHSPREGKKKERKGWKKRTVCLGHMISEVSVEIRYMGLKHRQGLG